MGDMDDEMPLAALTKPKKSSFDDDLPLANLAGAAAPRKRQSTGAPKTGPPKAAAPKAATAPGAAAPGAAAPGAAAPGATPGKGKGKTRKPKQESSSSSSSDSSDSSDSSSDSDEAKKAMKRKKVRLVMKEKKVNNKDAEAKKAEAKENKVSAKSRNPKEQVIVDVLCRWWYCMPDWPPNDPAYYKEELSKRGLRQVSIQEWEWVDENVNGQRKVYELSQFRGVFRSSDGEKHDLRPMDSCPSYNNMVKKDLPELYGLLVTAYEKQLEDLENSKYDESVLRNSLKVALTKVRDKAHQANEMRFGAMGAKKQKV